MDLFAESEKKIILRSAPLAARMRPRQLDQFIGQKQFLAPGKLLWRMLQADRLSSLIFFGPPGTGKTTLAHVIAHHTKAAFVPTHAASIGVAEIRKIIQAASDLVITHQQRTVLFMDEIHRFSRSQQDVLLDDVETGTIILIGATTENPFFSVNSALVSRSTLFEFQPLTHQDIKDILQMALKDEKRGLGQYSIEITTDAMDYLAHMSQGDARRALTALEVAVLSQSEKKKKKDSKIIFDKDLAVESIQQKALLADPAGDNHYDLASALQKSMRGSDPDATVYWLARLIAGGEDPRFIARRIAVTAAEDVGNADPMATVLAGAALQISEFIGLPEAQLPLAQAAIYIACCPKSNRGAQAIWNAIKDVQNGQTAPVPDHLRDSHYPGAKKIGRGTEYKYPHSFEHGIAAQSYLPDGFAREYYRPTDRGHERQISETLARFKQWLDKTSSKT